MVGNDYPRGGLLLKSSACDVELNEASATNATSWFRSKEESQEMLALVIDDSKTTRMILRRMLKELGFEVEEAENGREALDLLESGFAPNIVLVDWNMPVMDGYQFVKAVRSKPKFNKLVLMMVTTETELDRLIAALEVGIDEYVMKPFTKEVIEEKLEILGFARS